MRMQHVFGCGIILGTVLELSLVAVGVMDHPASVQGSGSGLLHVDIGLLLVYGIAGVVVWTQRPCATNTAAIMVGAQIGLPLGAVLIANHLIEAFVPVRPFVLVISPVLLSIALFGTAGAAAWERTRSLVLAAAGGVTCSVVATLITLSFATCFNLFLSARVDWQLREAFADSGMIDAGGFRVRNILEASSEILVRMPLFAICLAFAGGVIHRWMSRVSRRLAIATNLLAPVVFAAGASALWHANAIERAARPPVVMSGVLLSAVALCASYPIWSILRGSGGDSKASVNG